MDQMTDTLRELFVALLWLLTFFMVIFIPMALGWKLVIWGFMFVIAGFTLYLDHRRGGLDKDGEV